MTKSRTLRKAAAVALSLAMAFSVAGTTTANAAAKPSLKKTKVTVKVKKSVKVGIKNAKLVKKLTVKSKNSKVAKAAAVGKKAVKITGKKAGKTKVVVTIKYGKKTLKKNITVKVAKAKTDDDGTVVTESLKIVDNDGVQTDGTAIKGDELQVQIPASYGTIDRINWYVNDKLEATSSSMGDGSFFYPDRAGSVIARVVTTKGTTYASDAITVSDKELRATITGFTIEDDYEDKYVDLAKEDTKAILTATLNKYYAGKIEIYTLSNGKPDTLIGTAYKTYENVNVYNAQGQVIGTKYAKNGKESSTLFTNHALKEDVVTKPGTNAANFVKNADGSVTFKWFLAAGTNKLVRGKEVVALFDQDAVIDDDKNSATPNVTDKLAAPFVTVPSKLVLEPISKDMPIKGDFVGEDGKALGWIGTTANKGDAQDKCGIKEIKVYADKANTVSNKSTVYEKVGNNVIGGVVKTDNFAESEKTGKDKFKGLGWYVAEAKLDKAVYGGTADVVLTSAAGNTNATIAESAEVKPATDPKNAEIGFKNLRADATVYLIKGKNDADKPTNTKTAQQRVDSFNATDSTTYDFSVEVAKGAEKATIEGVWSKFSNNADDTYAIVVVPKDETNFGRLVADGKTLTQTVKKFVLASGYSYKQLTTGNTSEIRIAGVQATPTSDYAAKYQINGSGSIAWATTGATNAIEVKDQFGNDIEVGSTGAWSTSVLKDVAGFTANTGFVLNCTHKDSITSAPAALKLTLGFHDGDKSTISIAGFAANGNPAAADPGLANAEWTAYEPTTGTTFTLKTYKASADAAATDKAAAETNGTLYWALTIS